MKTFEVVIAFTDYIIEVEAKTAAEAEAIAVLQMKEDTEGQPQYDRMYVADVQELGNE